MSLLFDIIINKINTFTHDERMQLRSALDSIDDKQKVCDTIESAQESGRHCPQCGSNHIHRHGKSCDLQRYKCAACGKTFNSLTGTPIARLRKKELWLSYLSGMQESYTVRKAAAKVHVNRKTSFRWRHRFASWMNSNEPTQLSGIVEIDETYYRISEKGDRHLERKPRKRGSDKGKRGISHEQLCVLVACDRSAHDFEEVTGTGSVKGAWLDKHMKGMIPADSVMVTDGLGSYVHFANKESVTHIVVKNKKGERTKGCYHIQHVNAYHHRLRDWIIGVFHGVASKNMNHYLWWRHQLEMATKQTPLELFAVSLGLSHS
jgi:transposase-like protein